MTKHEVLLRYYNNPSQYFLQYLFSNCNTTVTQVAFCKKLRKNFSLVKLMFKQHQFHLLPIYCFIQSLNNINFASSAHCSFALNLEDNILVPNPTMRLFKSLCRHKTHAVCISSRSQLCQSGVPPHAIRVQALRFHISTRHIPPLAFRYAHGSVKRFTVK